MPDFERVTRDFELQLARTPEERAYVKGKHDGLDQARKQMVLLLLGVMGFGVLVVGIEALYRYITS